MTFLLGRRTEGCVCVPPAGNRSNCSSKEKKKKRETDIHQQAHSLSLCLSNSLFSFSLNKKDNTMAWPQLLPLCCTPVTWQPRPWTHKDCMDLFRSLRRFARTLVQYLVMGFLLFVLVVWIGSIFQQRAVDRAPDTAHFYNTSQVCGLVYSNITTTNHNLSTVLTLSTNVTTTTTTNTTTTTMNKNQTFTSPTQQQQQQQQQYTVPFVETFGSVETLQTFRSASTDTVVLHCETCGACSNDYDVGIYDATRHTLTETAIFCAKRALIWGRRTAGKCLARKVGFTPPCHRCWIDNILCDIRYCLFLCLWTRILDKVFARGSGGDGQRSLTACTTCDEKRCGPDFIRCAGANRRRCGIVSDIVRNDDQEVCTAVNLQWWTHRQIQDAFDQILHNPPPTSTTTTTFSNDEPPHHHLRRLLGAAATQT